MGFIHKIDRTGEININSFGSKMTIIKYNSARDVIVEFDDGYRTNARYKSFKDGYIFNPYIKTIFNIGYIGEGKYITKNKENNKLTLQYDYWRGMLRRCYDKKMLERSPTYENKEVCDEWLNFQNFGTWFDENYYSIENERMHLDKYIIIKGNKLYSPNTCMFVPSRINLLFTKGEKARGKYPIGVNYYEPTNDFQSKCRICEDNKSTQLILGHYPTLMKAFYEGYKPFKENYIKQVADEYKDKIPQRLYDAMYNWKVKITD